MASGPTGSGPTSRPIAVAITGGIGAGKSTALDAFRRHGAATVSSDEIVHHLLRTDPEVKKALVERLGEEILDGEGIPDRERIAFKVFKDREALDFLEKLLHPLVSREYLAWREQLAQLESPPRVCVTEVPLLYEVVAETRFDKVVVITAPTKLRGGLFFEGRFEIEAAREIADAWLVLDEGWLDDITLNTLAPAPLEETNRDGAIALRLGRIPAGDRHVLHLHFQVNLTALGRRSQGVELLDGDRVLASFDRDAWVWP